jgi:hypothetical protein
MKETKVCKACKRDLPLSAFRKTRTGTYGTCEECRQIKAQEGKEIQQERDERSKRVQSHGVLPTRRCAGLPGRPCPVKTFDHRCPRCLRAWRAMNNVRPSAEEEAVYDATLA